MAAADLVVVGAGPAGAAAAWSAARLGLRVTLVERGAYPRDKVCGEFVSAEALPLLQAMVPDLVAAAPRIVRAEFFAAGRRARPDRGDALQPALAPPAAPGGPDARRPPGAGAEPGGGAAFPLPRPALGISRLALDQALWQAAGRAGVTCRDRTAVTAVASDGDGFRLRLAAGGALAAPALIVAAGRCWTLAGLAASPAAPPAGPWVGVKARFRGLEPRGAVELYCFSGGYCGLAPVENGWINACCLIHRRRAGDLRACRDFAAWIAAAARHPQLLRRLRPGAQATPTQVTAPVALGPRRACHGAVLLAGDASGFLDPFTGDGIARALLSGALAAECLGHPEAYAARLEHAARPADRIGARLRTAVLAPAWLQGATLWALARPPFGPRLLTATRWRA